MTDPIYPVYIDSNVMIGRCGTYRDGRWTNVRYMPTTAENGFVPDLPKGRPVDVIYLCFPNNPTGTVITKQELRKWVNYALKNDALILFDAAYQAYIKDPDISDLSQRLLALRVYAAVTPSFRKRFLSAPSRVNAYHSTNCGSAANAPSSTAPVTSPSVLPRLSTRQRAGCRYSRPSTTICRMLLTCSAC